MALKSPLLGSLFKTLVFGLLLYWINPATAGAFSILLFCVAALILYTRPLFNYASYLRSFLVLLGLSVILPRELAPAHQGISITISALIFYIVLGLKEMVIVRRYFWHRAIFAGLLYESILAAALYINGEYFLTPLLMTALATFLIFSELVQANTLATSREAFIAGAILSFLLAQGFWVAGWLPLGFLSVVNLLALGGFIFQELMMYFYERSLNWKIIMWRLIVFVILAIVILFAAKWGL